MRKLRYRIPYYISRV